MKFIGRQREVQAVERFYQTPAVGLFILYGRRRIGETSLLSHFISLRAISFKIASTGWRRPIARLSNCAILPRRCFVMIRVSNLYIRVLEELEFIEWRGPVFAKAGVRKGQDYFRERMPQVTEDWKIQYVLFGYEGFTQATHSAALELDVRLVSLDELEQTLVTEAAG